MDIPSLGAMVLANAPIEARMKFMRDICTSLNIAHLHFNLNLTGTIADPCANETVSISEGVRTIDVTEYLSYDKILEFMGKGCASEEPLLRKDVVRAREIMIAIWKETTGVQQEDVFRANTLTIWKTQGETMLGGKISFFSNQMLRGPKIFKIICYNFLRDDQHDDSKEFTFWDIVFNKNNCYEVFANHWLV